MGILDEMKNQVMGSMGGGSEHSGLLNAVMGMLDNQQTGGLAGLVQSFKDKGLADIVSSWVSTGANLPISAEQMKSGLGMEKIQQLASQVGIPPEMVSTKLAEFLPGIVDKLTPQGVVPEGSLLQKGLDLLKAAQR